MQQLIDEIRPQLAPQGTYSTTVVAALMSVSSTQVQVMVQAGYLPRPTRRGRPGGGYVSAWTGQELADFADAFDPATVPTPDHDQFALSTCWRLGCRCDDCEQWHNSYTREWRRAQRPPFGEQLRAALIAEIEGGSPMHTAAESLGLSVEVVRGYARTEPELAARLDQACWSLCQRPEACGTPGAYRVGCRGTGCRAWRREQGRRERATA